MLRARERLPMSNSPTIARRRWLTPLVLAILALVVAACGGSTSSGGVGASGTSGEAAAAFPASSLFYADANIDQGSDAWKQAQTLAARFPGWAKVKAQLLQSLNSGGDGVTFA